MPKVADILRSPAVFLLLMVAGVAIFNACSHRTVSGVAETPAYFDTSLTLDDAIAQANREEKVVFAVVSADWCAPCQRYKRGALVDNQVAMMIQEKTVPVYVTDKDRDEVARLGVRAFPTTVILKNGDPVAMQAGAISPEQVMALLEEI